MAININKDITYKTAQPKEKEYLISDGGSLYLLVKPEGAKFWRFIYSFGSKRSKITLGAYPGLSLADARSKAAKFREYLVNGVDPVIEHNDKKQSNKTNQQNTDPHHE